MTYCVPLGLPHSEFLSWPVDDQAKALAWNRAQSDRCQRCRTYSWQWEGHEPYEADTERCRGCELLDVAEKEMEGTKSRLAGVKLGLFPRTDHDE